MAIDTTAKSATAVAVGSVAEADAYFTARGISSWTGTDAVKEQVLIKGWDYLERFYAGRWAGLRTTKAQALAWPRSWVSDFDGYAIDADTVPDAVKQANFEAALLILTGTDLEPVLTRGGAVTSKSVKAGPVETKTDYSAGAPVRDVITKIEGLLRGYITQAGELLRV